MSADRETNHDMTHSSHRDIALLLADAADEVEIGIAPYQAVVRGGRRRRARRWAVAAAAALVVAGSTGSLALAGALDGDGSRVAPAATKPAKSDQPDEYAARRTMLAIGTDRGKEWQVEIDVWSAPKDKAEARLQFDSMDEYGVRPSEVRKAEDIMGKGWVFVRLTVGFGAPSVVVQGPVDKGDSLSGKDIQAYGMPLETNDADKAGAAQRLVIGKVAPTARRVTCTWDDGTTTDVRRVSSDTGVRSGDALAIRPVAGSQPNWFVCLAPEGVSYESAEVTE
ncbi:hypothetical protein ACH4UV_09445 [Streptomyces sp. NPDC020802]|uniref:hypothetical protein n=1 Tax=Streptomyces sp. NPDC020802 TaxID=3365094 RepID=UPI00378AA99F